jgi:hypothetical protein
VAALQAGEGFSLDLALHQDIDRAFDFYLFLDAGGLTYTIFLNGKLQPGIKALFRGVPSFRQPFNIRVTPAVRVPAGMRGKTVTFYSVVTDAGHIPPVRRPSELTNDTPFVVMLGRTEKIVK